MVGTTIGNYVVLGKIGEGGMGVVYLAEHPRIGRKVAIKVLLPEYSQNPEVVARFFTEARASSAIKNEHIIDIIDFGELPDQSSYIIMEWLEGEPLVATLAREKKLSTDRALHIARGMGRALVAAHARNIVHRDLKPDNVFLIQRGDDADFVKVLDFGIAKLLGNEGAGGPQIASKTRTGAIIGTPMYMSPEQCRGVAVDARSDIYSFAVIVYQMLVGKVPFEAEGLGELLLKHMTEPPRPLREIEPSISETIERAVLRALQKDPAQRYASVADFVLELGGQISTSRTLTQLATPTAVHVAGAVDTIGAAVGETIAPTETASSRTKAWMFVLPAALAAAAVLAVVLRDPRATVDRGVRPAAAPVVDAPRTVVKPSSPLPARIRFEVRATPASAHVTVDGIARENPFVAEVVTDDKLHDVQVSASGFGDFRDHVRFDHAQSLAIVLDPVKALNAKRTRTRLPSAPPVAVTPQMAQPAVKADVPASRKDDKTYRGTKGKLITDFPSD